MSLNYAIQNNMTLMGSKTTAGVTTGVALVDYYNLDGTTTKYFTTGEASRMELIGIYEVGADETANSIQIKVDSSEDAINWYPLLNESISDGTSTLTEREFTLAQYTNYGELKYDAQSANFTAGLKLTGGTSSATGYIETDVDAGATGVLTLSNISGTFQTNETITDSSTGSATSDGVLTSLTRFSLPLDIQNKYIRVSAKETGVAANAGNIYMEVLVSGR